LNYLTAILYTNFQGVDDSDFVFMSFFPYADLVNVGTHRASWLDAPVTGWEGCMEPRLDPQTGYPDAENDDTPATAAFTGTQPGSKLTTPHDYDLVIECVDSITGPTSDVDEIRDALNNFGTAGTGRQDTGLYWGWRLLSPKWRGLWGISDYPAKKGDRSKMMIFITDGKTRASCMDEMNPYFPDVPPELGSDYGACKGRNELSNYGFEHIEHTCELIKDMDIKLAVMYINGHNRGATYLQKCASPGMYYDTDTISEITDAVADISANIGSGNTAIRLIK